MYLFDVRPLQESVPTGVPEVTAALCRAFAAEVGPGELLALGNAARGGRGLAQQLPGVPLRIRRFPNKLVHAGMRFFGRPTLEVLAKLPGPATIIASPHFLAVRPESKLLLIVHDLSFLRGPEWFSPRARLWHGLVMRRLMFRADRLVTFSSHASRDVAALFPDSAQKISQLPPGIPQDFFTPPARISLDGLRARFRLPPGYLLFLGDSRRKNLEAALAALVDLPHETLAVAGPVSSAHVRRLAGRSGVEEQVRTLGYLSPADYRLAVAGAGALLYPSYYEGLGLPPLHALALGVPVLASHSSALAEATGGYALLVDPHDAASLVAAITRLRREPAVFRRRSLLGQAWARRFSWSETARQLHQVAEHLQTPAAARRAHPAAFFRSAKT